MAFSSHRARPLAIAVLAAGAAAAPASADAATIGLSARSFTTIWGADAHVVSITGTTGADQITVVQESTTVFRLASDNGTAFSVSGDCELEGSPSRARCWVWPWLPRVITANTGAGNDRFRTITPKVSAIMAGDLGSGTDTFRGGFGADDIAGGTGNDSIATDAGDDRVFGGAGDDWIEGQDGADDLRGGDDADTVAGGLGRDSLSGEAGDDALIANADGERDSVNCGTGNDTAIIDPVNFVIDSVSTSCETKLQI